MPQEALGVSLDELQQRAFESIAATFVLTFFEDHPNDVTDRRTSLKERQARSQLKALRGIDISEEQLIMLLHGPGGSGKSTCMDLVTAYAKEFCKL